MYYSFMCCVLGYTSSAVPASLNLVVKNSVIVYTLSCGRIQSHMQEEHIGSLDDANDPCDDLEQTSHRVIVRVC